MQIFSVEFPLIESRYGVVMNELQILLVSCASIFVNSLSK